jgi:hypothetical protein
VSERDDELARKAAEREREAHEISRRIAEGGPDQHVPGNVEEGRVEAEAGRVKAEEARVVAATAAAVAVRRDRGVFLKRWGILVALAIAFVSLIPSLVGLFLIDREIQHRCSEAQLNREGLRVSVLDGLGTLGLRYVAGADTVVKVDETGKPLTPIAYYQAHPAELADAQERATLQLRRFAPISCDTAGFLR